MTLTVISTGSQGNAYLLENDQEALLIECGVSIRDIKAAIDFNFEKLVGCIVSHHHGDHAKSVLDLMKYGVNVWTSEATHKLLGTTMQHRACMLTESKKQVLGGFQIKAFNVDHDGVPCYGFLIYHKECGRVLFATDCKYISYTFSSLNNIIIEANFDPVILKRRVAKGMNPTFLRDRIFKSHMSLPDCIKALRANDLTKVNNIVLIHLSDSNSNERVFREQVSNATGKIVTVADNGLVMDFNVSNF